MKNIFNFSKSINKLISEKRLNVFEAYLMRNTNNLNLSRITFPKFIMTISLAITFAFQSNSAVGNTITEEKLNNTGLLISVHEIINTLYNEEEIFTKDKDNKYGGNNSSLTEAKLTIDEMPEFNGSLTNFLIKNLNYPKEAFNNQTQGTVLINFVIDTDGSIKDINVVHEIANGCTEEALRVIKSMPKWKPGKNKGEPVKVRYNLPIRFKIVN